MAAAAGMAAAAPAIAQEAGGPAPESGASARLEEIVVTAQKREQRLQDVPVAVTALTSEALTVNRISNVRDLNGLAPGFTVRTLSGGASLPAYSLRGILTAGNQPSTDKGVALYVDGVFIGGAFGTIFNMADIARVEVLRGPQGTLFGRNVTAGAVSITTREPTGEFGMKQTVTFGNYDQFRTVTSVTSPQMGPFSALAVYSHSERRGDIRNLGGGTRWDYTRAFNGRPTIVTSPKHLGDDNTESAFLAVKGDFDRLNMIYRFDYTTSDYTAQGTGAAYFAPTVRGVYAVQPNPGLLTQVTEGRPDAVNNALETPNHSKAYGHSLTATFDVNDSVSLKSIAAYRVTRVGVLAAEVSGLGGLINTGGPFLSAVISPAAAAAQIGAPLQFSTTHTGYDVKQWSEELQLNVDTERLTFTAGAMYYWQDANFAFAGEEAGFGQARGGSFVVLPGFQLPSTVQPQLQGGRHTDARSTSYAVYGQAEVHVLDNLDLVAGLRYTKERKSGIDRTVRSAINANEFPIRFRGDKVTYTLGVNYKPTPDILVYGKYATGYISGGAWVTLNFAPETAKSWEGGLKADWLDNTLRTNIALYHVKYNNLQINLSPRNSPSFSYLVPLGVTALLTNAGTARAQGVELETTYAPLPEVTFGANLGYLDFKYTKLLPAITTGITEFLPTMRPKWTVALSAQYTSPELFDETHMTARIDATWRSKQNGNGSIPLVGNFTSGGAAFNAAELAAYKRAGTIDSYWLANGRVALEGLKVGPWKGTAALWGRNLFNTKSKIFAVGFVSHVAAIYEPARTYGVDLSVEF